MEVEIKASIGRFINGLNNHDLGDIEATVFCPHFRIRGTNLKIWDTAKEFFDDFKALVDSDNWKYSIIDGIKIDIVSDEKAHVDYTFSRFTKDDSLIGQYKNLLIMTKHNGSWGIRGGSNCS